MEITGDDHVIFTFESPHSAVVRFILALQHTWPLLSIEYTEPDYCRVYEGKNAGIECGQDIFAHERSSLFFYCESNLRQYHEENGYTLNPNGIGPFAIMIRKRFSVEFQLGNVVEVHSDRDLSIAGVPEPYLAWLAVPQLTEITLVTPSHDGQSDFTNQIFTLLLNCLRVPLQKV